MALELIPSSFRCDCGHESHFFESTVNEMKKMSKRKRTILGGDENHSIVFYQGEPIEVICPKLGTCKIDGWE